MIKLQNTTLIKVYDLLDHHLNRPN